MPGSPNRLESWKEIVAEAHTSLAVVKVDYELDVDGAERELRRALQLEPGSAWVRHRIGHSIEARAGWMRRCRKCERRSPSFRCRSRSIGTDLRLAGREIDSFRQPAALEGILGGRPASRDIGGQNPVSSNE